MNNNREDKNQEYTRLNEELMMRIKNSYGDGVMLASFYLIFYATLIGVFCELYFGGMESLHGLVIAGLIFAFSFSVPIWILYAFAVKFQENFLAICNISEYLICYHEGNDSHKKWESLHETRISGVKKYEGIEYFLLGLFSLVLFLVTMAVVGVGFITMGEFNIIAVLVGLLDLVLLVVDIRCLLLIYHATDLSKLHAIKKEISDYYKKQKENKDKLTADSMNND